MSFLERKNKRLINTLTRRLAPYNVLSLTEYNADWLAVNGVSISVDPNTEVFTTTAEHGLTVGDPVEFDANGGALPGGVSAYNSDANGGTYYNVATVPSATTFTITATVGGTTPMDITSAGTGTWRVRKAGMTSFDITGLNLLADGAYEIDIVMEGALRSTTGAAIQARPNNDTSCIVIQAQSAVWTYNYLGLRNTQNKKYGKTESFIRLVRVSASKIKGDFCTGGRQSDDKSTSITTIGAIATQPNFEVINLAAELASIRIFSAGTSHMLIRNGAYVTVRRIN